MNILHKRADEVKNNGQLLRTCPSALGARGILALLNLSTEASIEYDLPRRNGRTMKYPGVNQYSWSPTRWPPRKTRVPHIDLCTFGRATSGTFPLIANVAFFWKNYTDRGKKSSSMENQPRILREFLKWPLARFVRLKVE